MRKSSLIVLFLYATSLYAQTPLQIKHCAATLTCTLPAAKAGDLALVVSTGRNFTDPKESWTLASVIAGWYGGGGSYDSVSYATAAGGDIVITFSSAVADISMLEYLPATFDQQNKSIAVCCTTGNAGPLTVTNSNELLILVINSSPGTATFSVPGFTTEDNGKSYLVFDEQVAAGTYSTAISNPAPYGAQLFAFKLGPPPPFVWNMPGLGNVTFPMQIPPACGPSDGVCSIQIQVCDTSQTPPVCLTASQGTLSLIKTVTLPVPQTQTIPVAVASP